MVPCCIFDECNETAIENNIQGSEPEDDCNNCSPFSTCALCNYYTIQNENLSFVTFHIDVKPVYNTVDFTVKSGYQFSFFQPPRFFTLFT